MASVASLGVTTTSRPYGAGPILRRLCLAPAVTAVVAWTARAHAEPVAGIDLHWVAPAACPGTDGVLARVRRLLGSETAEGSPRERLIVEGTVVATNARYRLSLTVRKENEVVGETRAFESGSCESLAGAAALTVALLARGDTRAAVRQVLAQMRDGLDGMICVELGEREVEERRRLRLHFVGERKRGPCALVVLVSEEVSALPNQAARGRLVRGAGRTC